MNVLIILPFFVLYPEAGARHGWCFFLYEEALQGGGLHAGRPSLGYSDGMLRFLTFTSTPVAYFSHLMCPGQGVTQSSRIWIDQGQRFSSAWQLNEIAYLRDTG